MSINSVFEITVFSERRAVNAERRETIPSRLRIDDRVHFQADAVVDYYELTSIVDMYFDLDSMTFYYQLSHVKIDDDDLDSAREQLLSNGWHITNTRERKTESCTTKT